MPSNTVAVDRTTGFGNPFPVFKTKSTSMRVTTDVWVVGTWNGPAMWIKDSKDEAVRISVGAFKVWIKHPAQAPLLARVKALRGKNLACWCPLGAPCHADVLLELANGTPSAGAP